MAKADGWLRRWYDQDGYLIAELVRRRKRYYLHWQILVENVARDCYEWIELHEAGRWRPPESASTRDNPGELLSILHFH